MPSAFGQLQQSIKATRTELVDAQTRGVNRAALETKRLIVAELRQVAGSDLRLSGVGKRGAKVGARYDVQGVTNPTALIRANGPVPLIERDTRPHLIEPREGRRSAGGRRLHGRRALAFGGGVYARAMHPGTRGRRPFAKGAEKAAKVTPALFQAEIDRGLRRAWA